MTIWVSWLNEWRHSIANFRICAEIPDSRRIPQLLKLIIPYLADDDGEDDEEIAATKWNWGKKTVMVPNPWGR